jgi:carbon starvation protein
VTFTAGAEKIWHPDPKIGFLSQARTLVEKTPALEQAVTAAKTAGDTTAIDLATKALHTNEILHFNCLLDAVVAGSFLVLVSIIVVISVREWLVLLARSKPAQLRESEPVWLPDYAMTEGKPVNIAGAAALALTLAKELSGEAHMDRAREAQIVCACEHQEHVAPKTDEQLYVEMTKERFTGVTRCC